MSEKIPPGFKYAVVASENEKQCSCCKRFCDLMLKRLTCIIALLIFALIVYFIISHLAIQWN